MNKEELILNSLKKTEMNYKILASGIEMSPSSGYTTFNELKILITRQRKEMNKLLDLWESQIPE